MAGDSNQGQPTHSVLSIRKRAREKLRICVARFGHPCREAMPQLLLDLRCLHSASEVDELVRIGAIVVELEGRIGRSVCRGLKRGGITGRDQSVGPLWRPQSAADPIL